MLVKFILLLNIFGLLNLPNLLIIDNTKKETKINYVKYQGDNFGKDNITFLINYEVGKNESDEDLVDIEIIFKNVGLIVEYTFNDSLILKGSGDVYAITPLNNVLEKDYIVNFNFKSQNSSSNEKIKRILILRKPSKKQCKLSYETNNCISGASNYYVSYENEQIDYLQQIKLYNPKKFYLYFDNKIDLSKIVFEYNNVKKSKRDKNFILKETYGIMYLKNKIIDTDIVYIEGKGHPIAIKTKHIKDNKYTFELVENYYLDLKTGIINQNYNSQRTKVGNIFLPYTDKESQISIEFEDFSLAKNKFIIETQINIGNKLTGKCYNSKYCLRGMW